MDNKAAHESRKVENYNFKGDFQILTLKEKRGILKNAKTLLKLQKEEDILLFGSTLLPHREKETQA
jgi:hypothetical protein